MTDNKKRTAFHYSARNKNYEFVKLFTDQGADIFLKAENGINCLHIAASSGNLNLCKILLNKHKFDVHMPDNDGFTALYYSVKSGNCKLVKFFTEQGADIFFKTENGMNCLHIAALGGHLNLCKKLVNELKFDVHMADKNGFAALHYSVNNGS